MQNVNRKVLVRASIGTILVGMCVISAVSIARPLATRTITVSHKDPAGGADAEFQGIQCNPGKLEVIEGDKIDVDIVSGVWCPEAGTDSTGRVTISVPKNRCGYTEKDYPVDEPIPLALETELLRGEGDAQRRMFDITITYIDDDCANSLFGANKCTVQVNCNAPDKTPTLSEWSVVVMVLVLLVAGTIVFAGVRRGRTAAA